MASACSKPGGVAAGGVEGLLRLPALEDVDAAGVDRVGGDGDIEAPGASRARVTRPRMTATASSRSSGSTSVCPAMIGMRKSLPSRRREVGEQDHSGVEPLHV